MPNTAHKPQKIFFSNLFLFSVEKSKKKKKKLRKFNQTKDKSIKRKLNNQTKMHSQACRHGLVHHLEHLLFYGADMDGRNASGNTSLHVCAVNNQEACARMLLFRGADRAALNYANQTPYQVLINPASQSSIDCADGSLFSKHFFSHKNYFILF